MTEKSETPPVQGRRSNACSEQEGKSPMTLAQRAEKWKPAHLRIMVAGRVLRLDGRCAEIAHAMATRGSVCAADLTPGVRLAAYIHLLRTQDRIPVATERVLNARGDGKFARYTLAAPVKVLAWTPGGRTL
ncbi:hypothetical protein FKB34_11385 [Glycocaulis profundi]|nr:hypothetical protein FKB34_11385 [Glycocaulis profundi]